MNKQAYIDRALAEMNEWRAQMGLLRAKLNKKKASLRLQGEAELDQISAKVGEVERRLRNMRSATEDAWKDMKDGVDEASDDLRKAFQRAKSRVGD